MNGAAAPGGSGDGKGIRLMKMNDIQVSDGLTATRLGKVQALGKGVQDGEARGLGAAHGNDSIAKLAYQYWQERGCPADGAEEDWYRAEQALGSDDE
jgi:hypothetical protein